MNVKKFQNYYINKMDIYSLENTKLPKEITNIIFKYCALPWKDDFMKYYNNRDVTTLIIDGSFEIRKKITDRYSLSYRFIERFWNEGETFVAISIVRTKLENRFRCQLNNEDNYDEDIQRKRILMERVDKGIAYLGPIDIIVNEKIIIKKCDSGYGFRDIALKKLTNNIYKLNWFKIKQMSG